MKLLKLMKTPAMMEAMKQFASLYVDIKICACCATCMRLC